MPEVQRKRISPEDIRKLYWEEGLTFEQIGRRFGRRRNTIWKQAKKAGIPSRSPRNKFTKEGLQALSASRTRPFNAEITCCLSHLLGIIWGDGSTYVSRVKHQYTIYPGLSEPLADKCLLLLRTIGLNPSKVLNHREKYGEKNQWRICGNSKAFVSWLRNLKLTKLESLSSSEALLKAFWQGMFEAEGHLRKYNDRPDSWALRICNTDKGLMEWGLRAMRDLGYHPQYFVVEYDKSLRWKDRCDLTLGRKTEIASFLAPCDSYKMIKGGEFETDREGS